MFLSIFDVFKIGVGPSSSHTMGPMVAAGRFLDRLREEGLRLPICGQACTARWPSPARVTPATGP